MQYLTSLEKFGLNQKEQEIYFALLQLAQGSANEVAKASGLKRPTTYDILYGLQKKGFIYETEIEGKRKFIAHPPEKLVEILETQKRELQSDLPILKSIYNLNPQKAKVGYFEGLEGIKQLYEDTLISLKKGDEILAYVTNDTVKFMEDYSVDYVRRRVEKGIRLRGIYQDSPDLNKYLQEDQEQLRTSKVASPQEFPLENEINIYADKVIIINYSPSPYGIRIESPEVANTQRSIFNLAWNGLI